MSKVTVPYFKTRLAVLQAACIFGTVAACIGLNALIRSNQSQTRLKALATPPMVIEIDVSAITNVGIVTTVGNILTGGFGFIFSSLTLLPKFRALANKTIRLQAYALAFSTFWVFVCMIPFMVFYMNDHASVSAFIGDIKLPEALVASTAARSGHSTEYQTMWFLRLLAIFPWFSIVAGIVAVFFLLKAARAVDALPKGGVATEETTTSKDSGSQGDKVETEKIESV